jgi:hypothetical protein
MSKEFLVSRTIEIPTGSNFTQWDETSDAIGQLRSEIQRLRAAQPVEVPVASYSLDDLPVDSASSVE